MEELYYMTNEELANELTNEIPMDPTFGDFEKTLLRMANLKDEQHANVISEVLNEAIEDDYIPTKYRWVARLVVNRIKERINLE